MASCHSTEYFFDYSTLQLTKTQDALGKVLRYYYDGINRVTKIGAGSTADIMPTYNYYDGTTGLMTKVTYTDAARGQARTRAPGRITLASGQTRGQRIAAAPATCVPVPTGVANVSVTMLDQSAGVRKIAVPAVNHRREARATLPASRLDQPQSGHTRAFTPPRNGSNSLGLTSRCLPLPVASVRGYVPTSQPTKTTNPNGPSSKGSTFMQCNLPGKNSIKLNPYGLVETFGYDSRNRLTRRKGTAPHPWPQRVQPAGSPSP